MNRNPFQLTFSLRQHTPIIHFQWNERDATIRPTELKAKLDRWIIARLTDCYGNAEVRLKAVKKKERGNYLYPELYKWLKGAKDNDKNLPALNYSVRIQPVEGNLFEKELNTQIITKTKDGKQIEEVTNKDYSPYFGNQLKVPEYREGSKRIKRLTFHKAVILTISSPYEDLINKIRKHFPEFLLKTNFGTRQGKGFGSFFLDTADSLFPKSEKNQWFNDQFDWKFDVTVSGGDNQARIKDLFSKIDLFYKTLRSGISPHDQASMYFKSLMWKYAKGQTMQWDKKSIKQAHFSTEEGLQQLVHSDPDSPINWNSGVKVTMPKPSQNNRNNTKETHLIWRDLLGLSSEQVWMSYNRASVNKKHLDEHSPNGLKGKIGRFKSPIFFKPVRTGENKFRVFFEVPAQIKNAFMQSGNRTSIEESQILGEWFIVSGSANTLELPYPNQFNYDAFLKSAFSNNPSSYVVDGNEIYTHRNGSSSAIPKKHGRKYSIYNFSRSIWVDALENNPALDFLTKVFSQLAKQVEEKKKAQS